MIVYFPTSGWHEDPYIIISFSSMYHYHVHMGIWSWQATNIPTSEHIILHNVLFFVGSLKWIQRRTRMEMLVMSSRLLIWNHWIYNPKNSRFHSLLNSMPLWLVPHVICGRQHQGASAMWNAVLSYFLKRTEHLNY